VNEAAECVRTDDADQPQHEQDYEDRPKHTDSSLSEAGFRRSSLLIAIRLRALRLSSELLMAAREGSEPSGAGTVPFKIEL
jgi:hypothetical protein